MNLNNVSHIEEKQVCDIFDSLRKNRNLTRLSVVNCDVSSNILSHLIITSPAIHFNVLVVRCMSVDVVLVFCVVYFNWVIRGAKIRL